MLRLLSYFTKYMKCDQRFVTGFQATAVTRETPAYCPLFKTMSFFSQYLLFFLSCLKK